MKSIMGLNMNKKNDMKIEILPDFIKEDEFMILYPCDKMTIFTTKKPNHLLKGQYQHLNYEFIITKSVVKDFVLDGKKISIEPDMVFAINSMQMHGTEHLLSNVSFISIQFEKEFLHDLALGIYGIKEIMFSNQPIPLYKELTELINTYVKEYEQKKEGYFYILNNLSVHIAVSIFRKIGIINHTNDLKKEKTEKIQQIIEYFKKNYEKNISLEKISDISNMSKFDVIRKFKESTGMTPHDYLLNIRIMKALEYLNNPTNKIIDVALLSGFENHSHFSKIFKKKSGLTPSEYRKKVLYL
ncbi:UNVERIFIED_CONTAM: Transcriptional regulator containing an amidase domain and an AraC-type DNA-binding HTH domain [Acetivibrio alkalicellulosi]